MIKFELKKQKLKFGIFVFAIMSLTSSLHLETILLSGDSNECVFF